MGFVPKRSSNETLSDALRMVMSGGIFVPPMTMGADGPADSFLPPGLASSGGLHHTHPAVPAQPALEALGLTPRQRDVLSLLLKGQPNKLIARELGLSVETVKDHVAAVLRALNVSSRTQAVLAVSQMVQPPGVAGGWRRP
jgi:DNA-binding NarL/FixJ family response regulator